MYGLANWASEFMNKMFSTGDFVNQLNGKGQIGQMMTYARDAAALLMVVCLIWIAVKMVIDKEPPKIKNVILQLFISLFLLTNLSTMSIWVKDESVSIAKGFLGISETNKKDQSSSLPFKILAATTNDNYYLINTNFQGKGVNTKSTGITIDPKAPDNLKPVKEKFGYNDLSKSEVDAGTTDFYKIIDWNDVDDNKPLSDKDADWKKGDYDKNGKHFLYGWLKYKTEQTPKQKSDGYKWISPDIPRWGGTNDDGSLAWGGYPRYEVDWIPAVVSLAVLTVAYVFAGYVIVKSIIEIVLMNILGMFLIGSDLSTGQKTKQVVSEIFSASLLIALQAFELAFYEAVVSWAVDGLSGNTWGFMVFILAASIMVITGSQKVTKFFGVDTGAQHGLRAAGSVMYAGKQIGKGAAALAGASLLPARAVNSLKNKRNELGRKFNTKGSLKRDAKEQAKNGARQQAVDAMAGFDKNGNRTVAEFDNPAGSMIHQTSGAKRQEDKAFRKAAQGTRQADIRQRRRDAVAMAASGVVGETSGWAKATSQSGDRLAAERKQFKETKPMKRADFNAALNNKLHTADPAMGGASTGKASLDRYHSFQKRAEQYNKNNNLAGNGGVNYNPETNRGYTYDEWRNNVDGVRTNDVPDINLDGSKSNLGVAESEIDTPAVDQTQSRTISDFDSQGNFDTPQVGTPDASSSDSASKFKVNLPKTNNVSNVKPLTPSKDNGDLPGRTKK